MNETRYDYAPAAHPHVIPARKSIHILFTVTNYVSAISASEAYTLGTSGEFSKTGSLRMLKVEVNKGLDR